MTLRQTYQGIIYLISFLTVGFYVQASSYAISLLLSDANFAFSLVTLFILFRYQKSQQEKQLWVFRILQYLTIFMICADIGSVGVFYITGQWRSFLKEIFMLVAFLYSLNFVIKVRLLVDIFTLIAKKQAIIDQQPYNMESIMDQDPEAGQLQQTQFASLYKTPTSKSSESLSRKNTVERQSSRLQIQTSVPQIILSKSAENQSTPLFPMQNQYDQQMQESQRMEVNSIPSQRTYSLDQLQFSVSETEIKQVNQMEEVSRMQKTQEAKNVVQPTAEVHKIKMSNIIKAEDFQEAAEDEKVDLEQNQIFMQKSDQSKKKITTASEEIV